MPGGSEGDGRIRGDAVVGGDQARDVYEHPGGRGLTGERMEGHHTKIRAIARLAQSC